jgi:hypothetical protein
MRPHKGTKNRVKAAQIYASSSILNFKYKMRLINRNEAPQRYASSSKVALKY